MSIKGAAVDRLSGDLNSRIVQRRSRIETDGIAAGTGNGDNGEEKEIVRRFERALSEGKSLDQAQMMVPVVPCPPCTCQIL